MASLFIYLITRSEYENAFSCSSLLRNYETIANFLAKYTGINNGFIVWPKVLKSYGVLAQRGDTKNLSDEQRIELLKKFIDEDKIELRYE